MTIGLILLCHRRKNLFLFLLRLNLATRWFAAVQFAWELGSHRWVVSRLSPAMMLMMIVLIVMTMAITTKNIEKTSLSMWAGETFGRLICGSKTAPCYIYIYIYGHPPPGPIRALGAGDIIRDNYIINMITCPKTLQIPVKNASWMHMTLNIVTFQTGKNTNFLKTESVFWKGSNLSSNCKPFAWKMHLTLQKAAWEAKNAICVKNICKQ